ncbi:MAG: hypothetical protein ILP22_01455 [Oscillospiraceae bacterium]|nr:hypothetical protein [Oscillospiraceae bacterium]
MRIKNIISVLTACTLAAGVSGNVYAGAESVTDNGQVNFSLTQSEMYRWPDDDGSFSVLSGEILSDEKVFSINPVYGDKTVKVISALSSPSVEYLSIPSGCAVIQHEAFKDFRSLKGIAVPDSVTSIEMLDQSVTIFGNPDSYAEFFAKNHGNRFVVSGDTDGDGKIGAVDITGQMLYMTGEETFEDGFSQFAADANMDGKFNIVDLIYTKIKTFGTGNRNLLSDDIIESPVYNLYSRKADQDVVNSYLDFASSFSDDVLLNTKDENGGSNRIYSPLSVYMAVSVLTECSDGDSLAELTDFLQVSGTEELGKINKDIFDSLYFDEFDKYCRMTNSIWLARQYNFEKDKLKTLADKYYTASFLRDFESQPECDDISEWISQNTSGKFKPFIAADTEEKKTLLKIINTVTFKEKWNTKFRAGEEGAFHGSDGDINCMFMHGEDKYGRITEDEAFTAYIKSFEDGYKMNFILPADGKNVNDIVSDSEVMNRVLMAKTGEARNVIADIPKFSSGSKFDLVSTLKDAGVTKIFNELDIEPLVKYEENGLDGARVSDIIHEAVIDVDEKGCEAAAYTIINADPTTSMPPEDYEFKADRPFIYFISNKDGVPLFVGIVNDPTQK